MKILLASGSGIYDKRFPETSKNQSGFGIMIRALADMLSSCGDEVDIITHSNLTKGREIGRARLLPKTVFRLLLHAKWFYVKRALRMCKVKGMSWGKRARVILGYLSGSYVEYLLKKGKYDVVHINGIGATSNAYMYACARTNTPYVLTLHGLVSFGKEIKVDQFMRNYERNYFIMTKDNRDALSTVISTGIKSRLCDIAESPLDQVSVVCNPIIEIDEALIDVYSKENDEKIVVCVGNISANKNQKLVVDSFAKMCDDHPDLSAKLFVIGGQYESLEEYAKESGFRNTVFTGALQRNEVYSYYSVADLCVMASLEEGFGLSLAEGYKFGVPSVMPRSIDAFVDLYDEACCVPADDYEIETFANAMYSAINKEWNKERIIKMADAFSEENCASGYLDVLHRSSELASSPLGVEDINKLVDICFS